MAHLRIVVYIITTCTRAPRAAFAQVGEANWPEDRPTSVARLLDVCAVRTHQRAALRFTEPHKNPLIVGK
jgi:hypothetical protein